MRLTRLLFDGTQKQMAKPVQKEKKPARQIAHQATKAKTAAKTAAKMAGAPVKADKKAKFIKGSTPAAVIAAGAGPGLQKAAVAKAIARVAARVTSRPSSGPGSRSRSAHGEQNCRETACEGLATSSGYCRLHYIKNWKKVKRKELILKEGKLNQYIEELVSKYPDRYIDAIRNDLSSDKEFGKVVHDLELDEGIDDFDGEGENIDTLIENIRRDVDEDPEGF